MSGLTVVGLFAGIGGIELGLKQAGFDTTVVCEIDPSARAVLREHLDIDEVDIHHDVADMTSLPSADVLAAGFPCQDLSQAGRKQGITGDESGLVSHVFRLLDRGAAPTWLLLENVPYMLRLDRGKAMSYLVDELEDRGFAWAYRVVDARSFGIAQRRKRVVLVASRTEDPRSVLFTDEAAGPGFDDQVGPVDPSMLYGFYWTEGLRGLGWTRNAVPTIKGGSKLGIASPPAVWNPSTGDVGTPSIEDVEALQGFRRGWTSIVESPEHPRGIRWRLLGNAVCVPMAQWVGERLADPDTPFDLDEATLPEYRWPTAAWGSSSGGRYVVDMTERPQSAPFSLGSSVNQLKPLSQRATAGFLRRARRGKLRFAEGFIEALDAHLAAATSELAS